ncbi:MAG: hypothetical protein ACK5XT_14765 [Gemmatimonas sp.]|jgi:hypothetical protein|uniref:hypothetical protein n=2 Tax=Gemmatimonas sp. TaxID=1962908 RepID=UPI00391EF782|nr:hypothetical protein [Gemmatimonadota bacterium]
MTGAPETPTPLPEDRVGRNIGVGCFTLFIGAVSGAMIGVAIGKLMGFFNRCTPEPGLPACEWWVYAGYGAVIGAVSLPVFALWRLRRADRAADAASTDRG